MWSFVESGATRIILHYDSALRASHPTPSIAAGSSPSIDRKMEPLSVGASIAGLITLAGKIVCTLKKFASTVTSAPEIIHDILRETESLATIFDQFQNLLLQHTQLEAGHVAVVSVDQLVIMLTGCVMVFSELEAEVNDLGTVDEEVGWRDRVKWVQK